MIYVVVFDGHKMEVKADNVYDLGTRATFYLKGVRVAYFDIPFGTSFGYAQKATEEAVPEFTQEHECPLTTKTVDASAKEEV